MVTRPDASLRTAKGASSYGTYASIMACSSVVKGSSGSGEDPYASSAAKDVE